MMNNYLDFQNGYKVLYEAKDKVTEEAPGPVYASQILQRVADKMCISYNKDTNEYVDLSQFKLIYSDDINLIGSFKPYPTKDEDIKIVIKDTDGKIVLGEGSEEPPVPKYNLVITCDSDNVVVSGAGAYEENTEVTVTVAPASGYAFAEGNAPKLDGVAMDLAGGLYKGTTTVGAEAKTSSITGVVVKKLLVSHDLLYVGAPDRSASISDTWASESLADKPEEISLTVMLPPDEDEAYTIFAINTNVAAIQDIQNALGVSELSNFEITSESYAGATYQRYTRTEASYDDIPYKLIISYN